MALTGLLFIRERSALANHPEWMVRMAIEGETDRSRQARSTDLTNPSATTVISELHRDTVRASAFAILTWNISAS